MKKQIDNTSTKINKYIDIIFSILDVKIKLDLFCIILLNSYFKIHSNHNNYDMT